MSDDAPAVVPGGFIHRSVPVEATVQSDGRTVEAYAAVFDTPAEIRDHEGHYLESIGNGAFKRAINRAKPQGGRDYWLTSVFYNHGRTLHGTPSERYSAPIGVTQHIEEDARGLLTVTRYADTDLGREILSLVRDGAIRAQSFTGQIVRSSPMLRRGQLRRAGADGLSKVTRTELGLTEYGPTPLPAYAEAEVVGVRSLDLSELLRSPDATRALRALLVSAPDQDSETTGADPDGSLAAADSPTAGRSDRPDDPFQRRLSVALRARGINQ